MIDQKQILDLFAQVVQSQLDTHKSLIQLRFALKLQPITERLGTQQAENMQETAYADLDQRMESNFNSITDLLETIRQIAEDAVDAER